jgi:hypothetical protein
VRKQARKAHMRARRMGMNRRLRLPTADTRLFPDTPFARATTSKDDAGTNDAALAMSPTHYPGECRAASSTQWEHDRHTRSPAPIRP